MPRISSCCSIVELFRLCDESLFLLEEPLKRHRICFLSVLSQNSAHWRARNTIVITVNIRTKHLRRQKVMKQTWHFREGLSDKINNLAKCVRSKVLLNHMNPRNRKAWICEKEDQTLAEGHTSLGLVPHTFIGCARQTTSLKLLNKQITVRVRH